MHFGSSTVGGEALLSVFHADFRTVRIFHSLVEQAELRNVHSGPRRLTETC